MKIVVRLLLSLKKEVGSFNCGNGDFVKVEFFVKETETDKCSVYYVLKVMDFTEDNVLTALYEFVNKTFKEGGTAYGI